MTSDATTLVQSLDDAARGLLFPSESDFPIETVSYGEEEPTPEALLARSGLAADAPVEETTLESLFEGLTDAPDDASESEHASAERFRTLMCMLDENLTGVRVYRLGAVDVQVFVVGKHASGTWLGVRTNLVET